MKDYTLGVCLRAFSSLCASSPYSAWCKTIMFATFTALVVPARSQFNFVAMNDTVVTSPLKTVTVDVVKNDFIPCSNHTLHVATAPGTDLCTFSVGGNEFVVATPTIKARGDTLRFKYAVTCSGVERTAVLVVVVSYCSMPANIIDPFTICTNESKTNLNFTPTLKYVAGADNITMANISNTIPNADYLDGFAMPLVGDLNGDGKPEIIAMGLSETGNNGDWINADGKYIIVFNGQTGERILKHTLVPVIPLRDDPLHSSVSKMAIADMDRDGRTEIVLTSSSGKIYCFTTQCDSQGGITGLVPHPNWPTNANNNINFKYPKTNTDKTVFGAPVP